MFSSNSGLRDLRSRTLILGAGQHLFHLGDPVRAMHIVLSGCIHLIRHQPDGASLILQQGGVGAVVAEASLYAERYHCDARAAGPAEVVAFARADFRRHLAEDPAIGEAWARHLAEELQRTRLHAEVLSIRTVAGRLDAWIAAHGRVPEKGGWKPVAQAIGASPEALYREMARRRRAAK